MIKKSAPAKLKFIFPVLFFILAVTCFLTSCGYAQTDQSPNQPFSINNSPLPAPTGFVNDYAGVLDAATKQQIEQKIKNFKATSNPQVEFGVAIVRTTGERPIFDYSLAVSRGWKIGSKQDDNPSALLFIAIDDRKYFTQVSKDLEDELPDGLTGSLQRQYLVPAFKQGNYGKGISDTIDAYIQTVQSKQNGTAPPAAAQTEEPASKKKSSFSPCSIVTCLIILFVLLIIIFSRGGGGRGGPNRNDRNRWGGGGGFGGGGGALPWIIGGILSSGGGSSSSSSSSWGSSGSDGGSSWGGFGGGGDFGGGGAGGDW